MTFNTAPWDRLDYKIKDHYLEQDDFDKLFDVIFNQPFPWTFTHKLTEQDAAPHHFQFTHLLFSAAKLKNGGREEEFRSPYFDFISNIILKNIEYKQLLRMKVNCYVQGDLLHFHPKHTDFKFPHQTALFYMNANDGCTQLYPKDREPVEISSVANRMLIFDGLTHHNSTNCTTTPRRINININYV